MKKHIWVAKIAESSAARIVSFFFSAVLISSFTVLAFRANADLTASGELQVTLAQQTDEIRAARAMNDIYNQGWLANEENFSELASYVSRLVHLAASPSLDPHFEQELSDHIRKNRSQVAKEIDRIQGPSFSTGILKQQQARLLEAYRELNLVLQTMEDIVSDWDRDMPQRRGEKMINIQNALFAVQTDFQATRISAQETLKYANLLDVESRRAYATGLDRIHADRTQVTLSVLGLSLSVLGFVGWVIFLGYRRRRVTESRE